MARTRQGRRDPWTAAAACCLLAGAVALTYAVPRHVVPPPAPVTAGTIPPVVAPSPSAPRPSPVRPSRSVPVGVAIPEIGLRALVRPVQLADDGTVPLPDNPNEAGWLASSADPGLDGTAVLVGHVDSRTGPAAFYGLGAARPGMRITVDRSDRTTAGFTVAATAVYPKDRIPAQEVYGPGEGPALHLITCTGWDPAAHTYRDNLVVFAVPETR
jgi:hypothetical protein